MTCSYCGAALQDGAMLCGECGRSVAAPVGSGEPKRRAQAPAQSSIPEPLIEPHLTIEAIAVVEERPVAPVPDIRRDAPAVEAPVGGEGVVEVGEGVVEVVELSIERCSQCGGELEPSDIFCGECGFVRHPAVVAPSRPNDTVGYDPFPWGLPRSTDGPRPAPPVRPKPASSVSPAPIAETTPAPELEGDIDETRIVDRSARGERFVLQFSTGESVSVTGTGLLGRNPVPEPGEYFDAVVPISDPGKSVSKTHLEFGQEQGSFWVSDRFSGNGTVVREPDRQPRRCDPGKRYRVLRGTRIDIGEQFFIVS